MLCLAVLVVCSVHSLQLDSQASTRKPRVTKYSKTTVAPGGSTVRMLYFLFFHIIYNGCEISLLYLVFPYYPVDISFISRQSIQVNNGKIFRIMII